MTWQVGEKAADRLKLGATILAGLLGIGVAIVSLFLDTTRMSAEEAAKEISDISAASARLDDELSRIRLEQSKFLEQLSGSPRAPELSALSLRLRQIEDRQGRIEKAIMADASRVLEVPMLKNEISSLKESSSQTLTSIKSSVDQVYDMNKWLLGAIGLAVIGLAISTFAGRKSE